MVASNGMRLKTQRMKRGKPRCCVVDGRGKRIACFAREQDAHALAAIVKKSRVAVACDAGRRR